MEISTIIIGIGNLRDKLALETQCYGRILSHDGVKLMGGMKEVGISQFEQIECMADMAR